MGYTGISLETPVRIEELFTIHYFEYMSNFSFEGESHNFWEFLYVDKGEVNIIAGKSRTTLKKGDVIFHEPNEFHSVEATGTTAPNLVVVSFSSPSPAMRFFRKKHLRVDEVERNLLADIIIEARDCFSCRLDDPYLTQMRKKNSETFGSEQMIQLNLEHFLIHIIRRYSNPHTFEKKVFQSPPKTTKSRSDSEIYNRVISYLESNISAHITIEQICRKNLIGRSQLQKIFREKNGQGVIEHFSHMKIDAAKQMIRTNRLNFTQVSEQLGYTSIHYFSRQFKKTTGMTPSEYASSIKAMAEGSFEN